jgi:AcrR family transcriptional regulator
MTSAGQGQGARSPLSRQRILETAVAIVDEEGAEALTMRRLGAALGVEAMSIYNHIPNKAALLDGIVEVVIGEIELPDGAEDWRDKIRRLGRSYRKMALRHPNFVPLLATRPFSATPALQPVEVVFAALEEAGLDARAAVDAYRLMASFALGYTMTEAAGLLGPNAVAGLGMQTAALEDYPHLAAALPYLLDAEPQAQFEYGLDVLLQGIEAEARK